MTIKDKYFFSLVFSVIGLSFLGGGLLIFVLMPRAAEADAARIAALRPLSVTVLSDTPPGREVLVEGRVGQDNPLLAQNFVAYNIEGLQADEDDDDGGYSWVIEARLTRP